MMNDMSSSIAAISMSRVAVKRIIGGERSLRLAPIGDPQRRRVLVAGRTYSGEPLRQNERIRAEIQRQRRQVGGVESLQGRPLNLAFVEIEFDFEGIDQAVHLRVLVAAQILAGVAVPRARDLVRAED